MQEVQEQYADKRSELASLLEEIEAIYANGEAGGSFKDKIERDKEINEIREIYADKKSELALIAKELEAIYGEDGISIADTNCLYNPKDCLETKTFPTAEELENTLREMKRVIALLENRLQEAILTPEDTYRDRTVDAVIAEIAEIYGVTKRPAENAQQAYPGIVGDIYSSMLDYHETASYYSMEPNTFRQLIYDARAVLAEFIVGFQPTQINGSVEIGRNLAVAGETRLHNTGIDGGLIVDGTVAADDIEADYISIVDANVQGSVEVRGSVSASSLTAENGSITDLASQRAGISKLESLDISTEALSSGKINAGNINTTNLFANNIESSRITVGAAIIDGDLTVDKIAADAIGAKSIVASSIKAEDILEAQSASIQGSLAVGLYSTVKETNSNSVALGYGNEVAGQNSFAIGTGLINNVSDSIVMGFDSAAMTIVKAQPTLNNEELIDLRNKMNNLNRTIDNYKNLLNMPRYSRWFSYIEGRISQWEEQISDLAQQYERILVSLHADTKPKVGFGISEPTRSVHISGAMKLEPMDAAPENPTMGDIYVNVSGALCVFLGEDWEVAAGNGSCDEVSIYNRPRGEASRRAGTANRR